MQFTLGRKKNGLLGMCVGKFINASDISSSLYIPLFFP